MKKSKKSLKAFTFFEILIVLGVVILFVSVVFVGLNSARAKTRDANRVSDLNQLKTLLQLYYMDNNSYPVSPTTSDGEIFYSLWCSLEETEGTNDCSVFAREFREKLRPYTEKIPGDPLYPREEAGKKYSYQYTSSHTGSEYKIHAPLEAGEPFEVYSSKGLVMEYVNPYAPPGGSYPDEEPEARPPQPPLVTTLRPDPLPSESETAVDTTEKWRLNGRIEALGSGGSADAIGFEWRRDPGGDEEEWAQTGIFMPGAVFSHEERFEVPGPGTCFHYVYKAKAHDREGGWGYGNEESIDFCGTSEEGPETRIP